MAVAHLNINNIEPINPDEYRPLLEDLQGNILRGHGRAHTLLVLIRFKKNKQAQARRFLGKLAATHVTSAARQEEMRWFYNQLNDSRHSVEKLLYREPGQFLGGAFTNVFLTYDGYEYLGFSDAEIPKDPEFRQGMESSGKKLSDPAQNSWDEHYRGEIHAMILAAEDDKGSLLRKVVEMLAGAHSVAESIAFEQGETIWDEEDESIEHFGYEDGRSQPVFFKDDHKREASEGGGVDKKVWDPFAPLNLVLVKDPGDKKVNSYGSYLVYRKLEQNVKRFRQLARELAEALGFESGTAGAQRAGALVVGRFSDATPLATDGSATGRSPALNKFNYKDDDKGTKCPQHAHIRTTNPREDPGERIARRGVPYGSRTPESLRWDSIEEPPERDVGLLFLCFQSKIAKQFEAIQERASKPDTFDPIIGQSKAPTDQKWPQGWDRKDLGFKPFNFHSVVTLKGGEYFFAPSISFLKGLAENKKPKSKKPKTKV